MGDPPQPLGTAPGGGLKALPVSLHDRLTGSAQMTVAPPSTTSE